MVADVFKRGLKIEYLQINVTVATEITSSSELILSLTHVTVVETVKPQHTIT